MDSLWTTLTELPSFPELSDDIDTDVLIIGGGITGILIAHRLHQAGINYLLVEQNTICSGVTPKTTAKVTYQHGLIYHKLIKHIGIQGAKEYLIANKKACEFIHQFSSHYDIDYKTVNSYVYSINDLNILRKEILALKKLNCQCEYAKTPNIPLSTAGAVMIPDQGQFNPLKFINAISEKLNIFENTKVIELAPHKAKTYRGTINANQIVVATHFPILNKHGGYFAKMYQSRSYVLGIEGVPKVDGIYIDESGKGLSFRDADNLLLLGGGAHRTGKDSKGWQPLVDFANANYSNWREKYRWATQDCMTLDGSPYIGPYSRSSEDIYVATGFNKWGMTSSVVAAWIICEMVQRNKHPYKAAFSPQRKIIYPQLFVNLGEATMGLLTPTTKRCPHLGCGLRWNSAEKTWDCSCHGSRFSETGELLDNPATDNL